jgi:beta-glucanase (GH16 family)
MNNTPTFSSNVSVVNGQLVLTKQSASSGALVHTDFPGGHTIGVGDYVEARINFPGNGTDVYNWAAWWITTTAAEGWPSSGEHDIAEIKGGEVTINYISPSGATEVSPLPAGYWGDAFHTYGIHRKATSADVYFDGRLVATYATSDAGGPNIMVLNVGEGQGSPSANGAEGAMLVDYVRAWTPA